MITDNEHIPTVKELLILYKTGIHSIISETEPLAKPWEKSIDQANSILIQIDGKHSPFFWSIKRGRIFMYKKGAFFSLEKGKQAYCKNSSTRKMAI